MIAIAAGALVLVATVGGGWATVRSGKAFGNAPFSADLDLDLDGFSNLTHGAFFGAHYMKQRLNYT